MDDPHFRVMQQIIEIAVDSRDRQLNSRASRRSGEDPSTPTTRTPIRRRASTCTGPMKPPPIKAAPGASGIMVGEFMVSARLGSVQDRVASTAALPGRRP